MTFTTHCQIARGPIDPAPMVDIVFLLLIFLVLSSPYVLQPGIGPVDPPTATPTEYVFQDLVVTMTRDNLLFFNNQAVTREQLSQALRAAAKKSRNRELIIKADQQVSHGAVVQIMSLAVEAGIPAISLATRPELTPAPAAPQ